MIPRATAAETKLWTEQEKVLDDLVQSCSNALFLAGDTLRPKFSFAVTLVNAV
jgi:hypothetical protein